MLPARKLLVATLIAAIGLACGLQRATAEPQSYRVYLAMIRVGDAVPAPKNISSPSTMISVVAQASPSCTSEGTLPVHGARITLRAGRTSQVTTTDLMGQALFSATMEPAILQIEWPAGLLPCPNSRPIVELPAGAGEVTFLARYTP